MNEEYFGGGVRLRINIEDSYEPELMGTAASVNKVDQFLRETNCFVIRYRDIVNDQSFSVLANSHRKRSTLATVLLNKRVRSNSAFCMEGEYRIKGFVERLTDEKRRRIQSLWGNLKICICHSLLLAEIPSRVFADFLRNILIRLIEIRRIDVFPPKGCQCAIDSVGQLH